jgi:hypothetical protein
LPERVLALPLPVLSLGGVLPPGQQGEDAVEALVIKDIGSESGSHANVRLCRRMVTQCSGKNRSSPMNVRFGITPIAWSTSDLPELGGETSVETGLAQSRVAGFPGANASITFLMDAHALGPLLQRLELDRCRVHARPSIPF